MNIEQNQLNVLRKLYDEYKLLIKLDKKLNSNFVLNRDNVKKEMDSLLNKVKEEEKDLYFFIDQMRLKIIKEFLDTIPKNTYRQDVICQYGELEYNFECQILQHSIFSYSNIQEFISNVDNIFNPNLFLEFLKLQKEKSFNWFSGNKISALYYRHRNNLCIETKRRTFQLEENYQKFLEMLLMFPEKKEKVFSSAGYYPDETELKPWEQYEDSYEKWLASDYQYKKNDDDSNGWF